MNGIGRRRLASKAREQHDDTVTIVRQPGGLTEMPAGARLAELERIHADEIAQHVQLASDHAALLDALHARSPQEWHHGDPATAALSYLRHLEDEVDRRGGSRKPSWTPRDAEADEPVLEAVKAQTGLGYVLDPNAPVPPRNALETAPDPGPAPDEIPGSGPAGPGTNAAPEALAPPASEDSRPTPADASSVASGAASTEDEPVQDEPDAEHDCAEGADS